MPIAIFDLDGTLCDDRRRRPLLPAVHGPDADYDAYHAGCAYDPVVEDMRQAVFDHRDMGHRILFITARPCTYMDETVAWIDTYVGRLSNFCLLMRPEGDHTPSPALKVRLFEEDFEWKDVVAAYDDREDVLRAFQAKGVSTENLTLVEVLTDAAVEEEEEEGPSPADCLIEGVALFDSRNTQYRAAYLKFGDVMHALYPDGISAQGPEQMAELGLLVQIVSKVTRNSGAPAGEMHLDSIADLKVYAAMLESVLKTPR
jgi:hypothetical protein